MVKIDDEGVPVSDRRMAVGMAMGLGTLPSFVLVLVMFVVDVQVLVLHGVVPVHEHLRIIRRP